MNKKAGLKTKFLVMVSSLLISSIGFLMINALSKESSVSSMERENNGDSIVIDNIDIEYLYDKDKYEVVELSPEAYVVVRGNKNLLTALKYSERPKFYVDLVGKKTGSYREELQWEGISESLDVEVYPTLIDIRLMEQQTVRLTPIIEYLNKDKVSKNKIIGLPELEKKEVVLKGTQEQLANVSSVKGYIDVSGYASNKTVAVTLKVYDRNNKVVDNINLLDKVVGVTVPVTDKEVVLKVEKEDKAKSEEPAKVVVEKVTEVVVKEVPVEKEKDTDKDKETVQKEPKKPVVTKEGTLSVINVPKDLDLVIHTEKLAFSQDVTLDLKTYVEGAYEITYNDNGAKKVFKFDLVKKDVAEDKNTIAEEEN